MTPLTEVETPQAKLHEIVGIKNETQTESYVLTAIDPHDHATITKEWFINKYGKAAKRFIQEIESQALTTERARMVEDLGEKFASLAHEQWSGWMKYLFSKCLQSSRGNTEDVVIPAEYAHRWCRQMDTPYNQLSEEEKESDRVEARKFLSIIKNPPQGESEVSNG